MKIYMLVLTFSLGFTALSSQAQNVLTVAPNPFENSTHLTIHGLDNDTTTLKIYSITGQVVADIFDSLILTDTISVIFEADTLPDGIYFAQLTRNSEIHIQKMNKFSGALQVKETTNWETINIYPNPTSGLLSVSTDLHITGIEIYGTDGRQVLQTTTDPNGAIDLREIESGIYMLLLRTDERAYLRRVVKL